MKVIWSKAAVNRLSEHLKWVAEDSLLQAERVEEGILKEIEELSLHPERYPVDRFKINNHGDFRAFEKFSLRVSYQISGDRILILRIRHVKQEPKSY
ncbi:type II toxin-antitoxin system RelE/ParE family toxin [Algoriphagus sp. H41]|uniref:Type II toxin-antitoxin system RelE/ParE family toxin n=1 Tax=Algoriphagus oliviformis TaxID=2811231 RepID=A0ABS3C855_9BACT|nr:type II toxin-antitoxin system RelE/ParE family toxin [Algoriphagus oliviformis]MBN7813292.1 type II toxin-antitoxin system RelE/ParE family toxin [Algoriphagus oliviformis]